MTLRKFPLGAAAFLALALGAAPAGAAGDIQHPMRLTGEMFIAGATLIDPAAGEPGDTHAYLHLTGAAARRLFEAIKGAQALDACRPGRHIKVAGPIACSAGPKATDAECDFALELTSGATASGSSC